MRLREFLTSIIVMFVVFVSAKALTSPTYNEGWPDTEVDIGDPNIAGTSVPTEPLPSPLISEDKVLATAYYDTLSILNTSNECSDFFGGPAASVDVFNGLIGKVRKGHFSPAIGIRMSGLTVNVHNVGTNKHYRLFEKVSINANGAFYRKRFSTAEQSVPGVGTFEPNTKEVRVLMFLHELGHAVKGDDGNWLLPDDGKDEGLSISNSQKIEDVCGDQIKGLGKGETSLSLPGGKAPPEKVVGTDKNP
jgi:hypothetical protein